MDGSLSRGGEPLRMGESRVLPVLGVNITEGIMKKSQNIMEILTRCSEFLQERGISRPRLQAELLLAKAMGMTRLDLYLKYDRPVDDRERKVFREFVRRRLSGEPLQYIIGEVSFREVTIHVDARVLIPRPETEVLVGEVVHYLRGERSGHGCQHVLEIGTGSGAIAISLAVEVPDVNVLATDKSTDAVDLARHNACMNGVGERICFCKSDLFKTLRKDEQKQFDVIVSNPPYISSGEWMMLPQEIKAFEPCEALDGGVDGLSVIRRIICEAPAYLKKGGLLALEIGEGQARGIKEMLYGTGLNTPPKVIKDLAGRERVLLTHKV